MANNTIQIKIVKEKLDVMDIKAKEILKEMIEKNVKEEELIILLKIIKTNKLRG